MSSCFFCGIEKLIRKRTDLKVCPVNQVIAGEDRLDSGACCVEPAAIAPDSRVRPYSPDYGVVECLPVEA